MSAAAPTQEMGVEVEGEPKQVLPMTLLTHGSSRLPTTTLPQVGEDGSPLPPLPLPVRIDPENERYPLSVVWTPIVWMTCACPCVGHVGICDDTGYIYDFRGSYTVGGDRMLFGDPVRYWDLSSRYMPSFSKAEPGGTTQMHGQDETSTAVTISNPLEPTAKHRQVWQEVIDYNKALARTITHFRMKEIYSMPSNNCYCMVAAALNAQRKSDDEPVETMCSVMWKVMWHGKYVSCGRAMRHLILPIILWAVIALLLTLLLIFLL